MAGLWNSGARAQHRKVAYGAESDFNSEYVWRGIVVDDRPVSETSAWVDAFGLNFGAWSSFASSSIAGRPRLLVSGLTLGYSREWNKLTVEPALDVYRWREQARARNTMESSVRLQYNSGWLHVFSEHAVDILSDKGAYFGEGGVHLERHITKHSETALEMSTGFGSSHFNEVNIGLGKSALNFLRSEISFTEHFTPHVYVRPHFVFIHIPDRQIREELESRNIVTFGFAMGVEF